MQQFQTIGKKILPKNVEKKHQQKRTTFLNLVRQLSQNCKKKLFKFMNIFENFLPY